ncbi:cytochrome P450 family protein [Amycolatopsis nigrescens]|uniref:cytochrome P450 family protein n=1 Tax=Amycolatopsis nigrescens TaxID=381445 RepID=UPI00039C09D8|nr:cytochrome P450 [Amycolatopsis nigrescens]
MTTELPVAYAMDDPALLRDPFGEFSKIREQAPVVRAEMTGVGPLWTITRYEDVKQVLSDPRFVINPADVPGMDVPNLARKSMDVRGVPPEYQKYLVSTILDFDGADHVRLRKLVSRAFTVRRIADLRPRVETVADELLAALPEHAEDGVVDLLEHFAYPLPIIVICELVGIPEEDRGLWREASETLVSSYGPAFGEAIASLVDYIEALIARRRAEPADDLISALIHAQDEDGDRLSDVEMTTMVFTLVLAGHETTAHLIGNGTLALLTHPDQLALLRSDPDLLPGAVQELLRWGGTALITRMRYAAEDVEIGGTVVRRGEAVVPILASANYDPRRFDDPDRLDVTRSPEGRRETHVAFAHGAHYCLGAALAKQEGEVAFGALLRHFPDLALGGEPERQLMPGAWRLARLPVRL